jgi:hypothetical protein
LTYEEKTSAQTTRAHPKQTGKKGGDHAHFRSHPSGSATHFSDLLHAYAAVGFPDDHGELLLATENLQPVSSL